MNKRRVQKLHIATLHNYIPSLHPNIQFQDTAHTASRGLPFAGLLSLVLIYTIGRKVLVGRPDGKRPLRRPRHRWNNIKTDIKKWDGDID
jgi:hypothetical protein